MADTGNVSRAMKEKDAYLTLEPLHKLVWNHLCWEGLGGKCGIFKDGAVGLSGRTGLSRDNVEAAFLAFAERGWLESYNGYRWIVSYIKYNANSPNWKAGAKDELLELASETVLARRCLHKYWPLEYPETPFPIENTASDGVRNPSLPFPSLPLPNPSSGAPDGAAVSGGEPPAVRKRQDVRKWPADTDWPSALEVAVAKLPEPAKVSFKAWIDARNARRVKGIELSLVVKDLNEILFVAREECLPLASLEHGFTEATRVDPPAEKVNFVLVCARRWAKRQGPTDWDGKPAPVAQQREEAEERQRRQAKQAAAEQAVADRSRKLTDLAMRGLRPPSSMFTDEQVDAWIAQQNTPQGARV